MYTKLFYDTKLKAGFEEIWKGGLLNNVPPKHRINWQMRFTREHLMKESDDLRKEISRKCEAEYAQSLEEWKTRMDWTGSAKDYSTYVCFQDVGVVCLHQVQSAGQPRRCGAPLC